MTKPAELSPWAVAAFLGAVTLTSMAASRRDDRDWYRSLDRPAGAPPGWVFPVVWTGLDLLQGWVDRRIFNDHANPDRKTLLGLRAANWALYTLFIPAFFRARSPVLGEAVTLAEGVIAGATVALLSRRDRLAAAVLAPLLLWTGYASVIGGALALRNRDPVVDWALKARKA